MGISNEFVSAYHDKGFTTAIKWAARNAILSGFQSRTYALVNALSPIIHDKSDIEERLRSNGSIEYYSQGQDVTISPPIGSDHPEILSERSGSYSISRPFVGEIRDVHLFGSYPIPICQRGRIVLESVVSPPIFVLNLGYSMRELLDTTSWERSGSSPREIDLGVLLYNRWNRGYYHWTAETLTVLEGVEQYAKRNGETPKLIVGPELNRYQQQSLKLLGYGSEDLIKWDRFYGRVNRFVVPSIRRELNLGETSPVAYWWLRNRMLEAATDAAPDVSDEASSYVYLSREDAPRRRVKNEEEVLDVLGPYGFEKYVLSDRSVAENVELFAQADVIVGPHGAGLTDIIYSTDATVIELFRSNDVRPTYYVLSEQLGHRYRYLCCEYEGPNLVVDTTRLEEIVANEIDVLGNDSVAGPTNMPEVSSD